MESDVLSLSRSDGMWSTFGGFRVNVAAEFSLELMSMSASISTVCAVPGLVVKFTASAWNFISKLDRFQGDNRAVLYMGTLRLK